MYNIFSKWKNIKTDKIKKKKRWRKKNYAYKSKLKSYQNIALKDPNIYSHMYAKQNKN